MDNQNYWGGEERRGKEFSGLVSTDDEKIIIEVTRPHGTYYWTARLYTPNKGHDVASTGSTPVDAILAAMVLLPDLMIKK